MNSFQLFIFLQSLTGQKYFTDIVGKFKQIFILPILFCTMPLFIFGQTTTKCVNFKSSSPETFYNDTILFTNLSVKKLCKECGDNFKVKAYSWTFPGAEPVSAEGPGPHRVRYIGIGTFPVQLTVSYYGDNPSANACIKVEKKENFITIKAKYDVELESFEANPTKDRIKLYWTTVHEKSNDYFLVEKAMNGDGYVEITKIKSVGDHSKKTIYSDIDPKPSKGESKYRLSQVSKNGKKRVLTNLTVTWYDINEALNIGEGEKVFVIVEDLDGKEIYSKIIIKNVDSDKIYAIDPSQKIKPGSYIIIGSSMNEIYNKLLIVEKQ